MKPDKRKEFDNILSDCLDRLVRGESVEVCLSQYPEASSELEPLLRTAVAARVAAAVVPRSDFRARARYEFRAALHEEFDRPQRSPFSFKRGWAVALVAISTLLLSGGGAALAANDSMPDSRLYPVKLASEQVQLTLTPSATSKVRLFDVFAKRRVHEILYMAAKGDTLQVNSVTELLNDRLNTMAVFVSDEWGGAVPEEEPAMMSVDTATAPLPPDADAEAALPRSGEQLREPPMAPSGEPEMAVTDIPPDIETYTKISPDGSDSEVGGAVADQNRAELRMILVTSASDSANVLQDMLNDVSPAVQSALNNAIAVSEIGYRKVLAAIE